MKSKITLAVAGLAMSLAMNAQTLNFRYCSPKAMEVITTSGEAVNYIKAPDTSAPTLYFGCEPETDNCGYMWSDDLDEELDSYPYCLVQHEVIGSVKSTADFWEVSIGNTDDNFPAYIAKKATIAADIAPVTISDINESYEFYPITKGKYAGLVIGIDKDEFEGWSYIMVGMIMDGKLVFSHRKEAYFGYNFDEGTSGMKYDTEDDVLHIKYGDDLIKHVLKDNYDCEFFDIDKLTDAQKQLMLSKLNADGEPNTSKVYVKFEDNIISVLNATPGDGTELVYGSKQF